MDSTLFPRLFKDLLNEGIFKSGYKALFLTSGDHNSVHTQHLLIDNDIDFISESDPQRLTSVPKDTFDFIFSPGFSASDEIDRTLKMGGVVVVQLPKDPSNAFKTPSNYKIVYLRRFETTVVAMRKTSPSDKSINLSPSRRLLAFESEAKKAALDGLEDVILEPPRGSSTVYKNYLRKTKYLPELTGDSLDGYSRRVFIEVALPGKRGNGNSIQWFKNNDPTRNRVFDMYNIEMVADSSVQQVG
ncbi:hypothetical protein, partial [Ralstonia pseudosolanacearum]|uniref:hypothetical protein n=1 Tax=Ralstonia pseudosolanacearum TaxID=1310165 RepID=UPI003CF790C1